MSGAPTSVYAVTSLVASVVQAAVQPLGASVARARAWPVTMPQLPAVLVYGWSDDMTSTTISSPNGHYRVRAKIVVQAVVSGIDPEAADLAAAVMVGAFRDAVMTSDALIGDAGKIEKIVSVRTEVKVPQQPGEVTLAEATCTFEMEWSEGYEIALDLPVCDPYELNLQLQIGGTDIAAIHV